MTFSASPATDVAENSQQAQYPSLNEVMTKLHYLLSLDEENDTRCKVLQKWLGRLEVIEKEMRKMEKLDTLAATMAGKK